MSPAEILCAFMEPKPDKLPRDYRPWRSVSELGWWHSRGPIHRSDPTEPGWVNAFAACRTPREWLGMLHEIEARLTIEQWVRYFEAMFGDEPIGFAMLKEATHASAEQKIAALAAVIGEPEP